MYSHTFKSQSLPLSRPTRLPSMEPSSNNNNNVVIELKRSLVPPKWEESVRVLGMDECREAALTLAHAFAADEYAQYLVDPGDVSDGASISPEDKWKLHVDIMTYAVAAHCLGGLVTCIGPDYDSVALWLPPGKDLDGWVTLLRSGMWRLYFTLSAEGRKRYFDEVLPLLHDTKAQVLGDRDHEAWYLVFLGTKPNSQGRGYGRRLVEDGMRRADAENRPMYLESSSLVNNKYYARYGFEVQRDIFLERGKVPVRLSVMVREPGAGRKSKSNGGRQMVGMGMKGLGLAPFHVVAGVNAKIG
ncbi:hypothetical protein QBC34DRAFT_393042 [Podospora aff. communis PSN243]|uniref:N-acetyltransferase domain-containing protein n=1 Tax=Podospora aff. communis PSN243 TaxID=3040156 RepID=A0AAV9H101_9PEZI|nr:hypothetical protein QBC34DRAFT_393042 [Podospora aff. communis PSN243]